jgi:putative transposase
MKECYWEQNFGASGYGVWSTGNITDKMSHEYLGNHCRDSSDNSNFILK